MAEKLLASVFNLVKGNRYKKFSRLSSTSSEFWSHDRDFIWWREISSEERYFRRKDKEQIEALRQKLKVLPDEIKNEEKFRNS